MFKYSIMVDAIGKSVKRLSKPVIFPLNNAFVSEKCVIRPVNEGEKGRIGRLGRSIERVF